MKRKLLFLIVVVSCMIIRPNSIDGYSLSDLQNDQINILLVYTNKGQSETKNIQQLNYILHHFTDQIMIVSDDKLNIDHLDRVTHVIYYGEDEQQINSKAKKLLNHGNIPMIAIGYNVEQLAFFEKNNSAKTVNIQRIHDLKETLDIHLSQEITIQNMQQQIDDYTYVFLYGARGYEIYPLLGSIDDNYYFSFSEFTEETIEVLVNALHDILPNDHPVEQHTYLMIDGIDPSTDPDHLLKLGKYLQEKEIPFLLNVQPIKQVADGTKQETLSRSNELVNVLQQLQTSVGSIVIDYHLEGHEELQQNQSVSDFPNLAAYEQYVTEQKTTEENILKETFEKATHELLKVDLYPLAIHLSDELIHGENYKTVGDYFSVIFKNQKALTKQDQLFMPIPFLSTVTSSQHMTVYPITRSPRDFDGDLLNEDSSFNDSIQGGIFPVDLTVEQLANFIEQLNYSSKVQWFNLVEVESQVQTEKVLIKTNHSGNVLVDNQLSWWDRIADEIDSLSFFEKVLWIMTIVVMIFISLFLLFALHLRFQLKKRLFMERKTNG